MTAVGEGVAMSARQASSDAWVVCCNVLPQYRGIRCTRRC